MFEVAGWGDPTGRSPAELAAMFAEVERARRLIEAAAVAIVGEVQRSGAFRADGHASVSGWLRAEGRWSNAEALQHRQVADLAAASPEFSRVLAGGGIGWAQSVELGRAHANPRCGHEVIGDLDTFLARADHVPHRELRDRLDTWVMLHDLPAAHDTAELAHEARTASITVSRGVVRGSFSGSGAVGAAMLDVFERFRALEFEADLDHQADGVLPRSDAQRRFDALAAIFEHATAAVERPVPGVPAAPLVNLMIDTHTLAEVLAGVNPFEHRLDPWHRQCGTTDGQPLTPGDVLAAMWWGHVRTVLVDDTGQVLGVSRRHRLFRGRARDAALLNATHCVWPGCERPAHQCQADHLHEHHAGGTTTLDNAAPLCGRHNRFKHTGRYRIVRHPDGSWHTHPPGPGP